MRRFPAVLLLLATQSRLFALTGTVKNGAGAPVSGATLFLASAPAKTASSDGKGEFSLETGAAGLRDRSDRLESGRLDLQDGRLFLAAASGGASGAITLVSSDGKAIRIQAGPLGYDLPSAAAGLYLVRVDREPGVAARLVRTGDQWLLAGAVPRVQIPGALREAASIGTLVASKTGYATARIPIPTYDQAVSVVLDTALSASRSTGCDKTRTLANGTRSIQSGGKTRKYILGVPASYDKSQAYRLVVAYAESGSSAQSVANRNYFRMAGYDPKNTIFVAPDAENGAGSWSKTDVGFTDDILAEVQGDLCIDKSRIFATGFSFGGAMSIAIACTRADVFRGVAFFSGADLTGSCPTTLTKSIAYYASQASGDASGTPMPTSGRIKQAEFAKVNGCTAESNSTTFPGSGKAHTCTVYKNCSAGHPTVYCVFDGPHGWEPVDPGQSSSWDPPEAWKFITQF